MLVRNCFEKWASVSGMCWIEHVETLDGRETCKYAEEGPLASALLQLVDFGPSVSPHGMGVNRHIYLKLEMGYCYTV